MDGFLSNLQTVAVQVVILYLIAAVGFVADKSKIFVRADATKLVDLLFNMILPIAIINSFLSMKRTKEHLVGLAVSFLLAFLTHFLGMGIAELCFKKRSALERGVYHYAQMPHFWLYRLHKALPVKRACFTRHAMLRCLIFWLLLTVSEKYRVKQQKSA